MANNLATIKGYFENDSMKKKFQDMLGEKAQGFMVSVLNTVSNNKSLQDVDPNSIMFAAATAATLDLPINQNLGFAYIIPYKGEAQFQIGYKGFIQLAQRSGQFKSIYASEIYEGQLLNENPLDGYEFDFKNKTSDKVIGYASKFKLLSGYEAVLYMTVAEIEKHGSAYSQSYKKGFGLWKDNFDAMAKKTVIKQLLSKFAPLSIAMQKAQLADQGIIKDIDGEVIDYVDNKPESLQDVDTQKELDRMMKHIVESKTLEQLEEIWEGIENLSVENPVLIAYGEKQKEFKKREK